MNVKVVIGAQFGDECKGLMTDYFCAKELKNNDKVLNIRFNGGAQAGHTVETIDGIKHVFSHFGSGTLAGADTYLSKDFIINPILFRKEYETLIEKGFSPKVFIHDKCRMTIPQDMLLNQIIEKSRNKKHGSCGVGIYETIRRYESMENDDYLDGDKSRYLVMRIRETGIENIDSRLLDYYFDYEGNISKNWMNDMKFMYDHCIIVKSEKDLLRQYNSIVFEGAQGLMLDQNNHEYFPHLTPSNTGLDNVIKIIQNIDQAKVEICYVSRSYVTRHGAGRMSSEIIGERPENLPLEMFIDETNQPNQYQGTLRHGYFIGRNLFDSIYEDFQKLSSRFKAGSSISDLKLSLAITHLNIANGLIMSDRIMPIQEFKDIWFAYAKRYLDKNIFLYGSYSKTKEGVTIL